jgi:hypothetical protein
VVRDVELVVLHLVVWTPVFVLALAVAVVAATVFEAVFHDVGGDGGCAACGVVVAQGGVGVIFRVVLLMLTHAEVV